MQITQDQARLVHFAAQHYVRSVAREEGDVATFTELSFPADSNANRSMCEVDVVRDMTELRAVLGY